MVVVYNRAIKGNARMFKGRITLRDMCHVGIFTAICAVLAQISIPMPLGVPMTLQTFGIILAGVVLGPKKGCLVAVLYLLLGMVGVPVFAGFTGGIGVLFGKTGGFILTFPLMSLCAGIGSYYQKTGLLVAGIAAGMAANYLGGMVMFSLLSGNSLWVAFTACVLPFVPTAVIKAVAAGFVGVKLKKIKAIGAVAA